MSANSFYTPPPPTMKRAAAAVVDDVADAVREATERGETRNALFETDRVWPLAPWINALGHKFKEQYDAAQSRRVVKRRCDMYTQEYRNSRPSEGDTLLRELRKTLAYFDSIGYKRSVHQRKFHDSMIASCIRHIYKARGRPRGLIG
jgi:hypothetical protein